MYYFSLIDSAIVINFYNKHALSSLVSFKCYYEFHEWNMMYFLGNIHRFKNGMIVISKISHQE